MVQDTRRIVSENREVEATQGELRQILLVKRSPYPKSTDFIVLRSHTVSFIKHNKEEKPAKKTLRIVTQK